MQVLEPFQAAGDHVGGAVTGVLGNYLDLVGVREENVRLKVELEKTRALKNRMTELEQENRRLAELLELRDVLGMKSVAANVIVGVVKLEIEFLRGNIEDLDCFPDNFGTGAVAADDCYVVTFHENESKTCFSGREGRC